MGNLTNGVCISLTLSFSLTIVAIAIAKPMAIGHSSDNSNIVGTARSYGMGNRKTMSNLTYGVGLGLSLAIVSNMWISYTSHHPNIVGVTSSIGIVNREA